MSTYTENSRTSVLAYTVISWNMPTGDKLKWNSTIFFVTEDQVSFLWADGEAKLCNKYTRPITETFKTPAVVCYSHVTALGQI